MTKTPFSIKNLIALRNSPSEIIPSPYHKALFLTHSGTDSALAKLLKMRLNSIAKLYRKNYFFGICFISKSSDFRDLSNEYALSCSVYSLIISYFSQI